MKPLPENQVIDFKCSRCIVFKFCTKAIFSVTIWIEIASKDARPFKQHSKKCPF